MLDLAMSNDPDELWRAYMRKRWLEVSDAICKFRFELLESQRRMPGDQRKRLTPEAAGFEALLQEIDLPGYQKMLDGWTYANTSEFREKTLASLNCDPDAWKRGNKS